MTPPAAEIVRRRPGVPAETIAYLKAHYGVEQQLQRYAEVILGAKKLPPVQLTLDVSGMGFTISKFPARNRSSRRS